MGQPQCEEFALPRRGVAYETPSSKAGRHDIAADIAARFRGSQYTMRPVNSYASPRRDYFSAADADQISAASTCRRDAMTPSRLSRGNAPHGRFPQEAPMRATMGFLSPGAGG